MRETESTRWLIGRCVVLCVHVGWFVGWRGMNVSGVVVGESTSALGDRRVCVGSYLIRVTSMHSIKSIRMFEDDVT